MKTEVLDKPPHKVSLANFIGERSWLLFQRLETDTDWLYTPAVEWPQSESYQSFCCAVRSLKVVNDCAERSIKDVTDSVNYARDGDQRRHAIIVAQHHRQLYDLKNLTKAQLDALDDYL